MVEMNNRQNMASHYRNEGRKLVNTPETLPLMHLTKITQI